MPFSGTTYTNVAGATTAVAGNVVQSAVWDNIHTDIGAALTQLMQQMTTIQGQRNLLYMNGGFEVWQRGAGASSSIVVLASNTAYTADRWYIITGANENFHVNAVTGLTNASRLAGQAIRDSGQTGTQAISFAYPFDTEEIQAMRGNKVSFSSLVQAGANWSPTNGTLSIALFVGTGVVGKRGGTPYTNETTPISTSINLTAGGAVTSFSAASSVVIPTGTTQAELQFFWTPVGTAGAADSITIDDVQLEVQLSAGTWTPTNYDRRPFPEQLNYCKRHFWKTFVYSTAPVQNVGTGTAELYGIAGVAGAGSDRIFARHPISMRTTPAITFFNPAAANAQVRDENAGADCSATSNGGTTSEGILINTTGNAGTSVGNLLGVHITADAGI